MGVTLKEIAAAAGVSVRSVTRALKNEAGGNEDTCNRIREIAASLGYMPNMAARNLRLQRNNIIGMVSASNPVSVATRKLVAMQRGLEAEGFYPISALMPESPTALREILKNWTGLADTIIFTAWPLHWQPQDVLGGLPLKAIFVDALHDHQQSYAVIDIDRKTGVRHGITHLIRSGRRRVVQCGSRMADRIQGFEEALRECGLRPDDQQLIETANLNHEDGYQAAERIIAGGYDAVFFHTDRMALGFFRYCYENDIRVPEQVAVVGFDDDPAGQYACPSLSTVAQPVELIGRRVLELVRPGGFRPGKTVFPTEFIRRGSV